MSLPRSVYRFGSVQRGNHGFVILGAEGEVKGYSNPSESKYRIDGDVLSFLTDDGRRTSSLQHSSSANVFLPFQPYDHYLIPVVSIDADAVSDRPSAVFINTIPKAGTYLLEHALRSIGWRSLNLHLCEDHFHDNRQVSPDEWHRDPESRRVSCPAEAVAALMSPGEFAVGHVAGRGALDAMRQSGVKIVSGIRDLRTVLASLYTFKLEMVDARDPGDALWRQMRSEDQFMGFLAFNETREIARLLEVARTIADDTGPKIRFEDLRGDGIPQHQVAELEDLVPGLGVGLHDAVPCSLGAKTSTLSGRGAAHWETYWTDPVQRFFEASGLADINRRLGYHRCDRSAP